MITNVGIYVCIHNDSGGARICILFIKNWVEKPCTILQFS